MKQPLLIFLLFLPTQLRSAIINPDISKNYSPPTEMLFQEENTPGYEEGLSGDTAVWEPIDNELVQCLIPDHHTVLNHNNEPKIVTGKIRRMVSSYVKMTVGNETIIAAPHQSFYLFNQGRWQRACNIMRGDSLACAENGCVDIKSVVIVQKPTLMHSISVEDQLYTIGTYRIITHNSDLALAASGATILGELCLANPIIASIGAAVAFATIATSVVEKYRSKEIGALKATPERLPAAIRCEQLSTERHYYEKRMRQLQDLYSEYRGIVKSLQMLLNNGNTPFTATVFELIYPSLGRNNAQLQFPLLSTVSEEQLTEEQTLSLRSSRKQELLCLEEEVCAQQWFLALHFSALIEQRNNALEFYKKEIVPPGTETTRILVTGPHLTQERIFTIYEQDLTERFFAEDIIECNEELQKIASFYNTYAYNSGFARSSNLADVVSVELKKTKDVGMYAKAQLQRIVRNIVMMEKYAASRKVFLAQQKQKIAGKLRAKKKAAAQAAAKALKEKNSSLPKKPEDDDDKDEDEETLKDENGIIKVDNMDQFFKKTKFGRAIEGKKIDTEIIYKGKKVYKMIKDVAKYLLKKGDLFYLDSLHKDHLEVFDKFKKFSQVLNLNGACNAIKSACGSGRRIRC